MITLLAILALQSAEPRTFSGQCLTEVAALTGERVNFMDSNRVAAANRKATLLWENAENWIAANTVLVRDTNAALADLKRREDAGEVPAGATAIEADQRDRAMVDEVTALRQEFERDLPSCGFPVPEAVTNESLRAARGS